MFNLGYHGYKSMFYKQHDNSGQKQPQEYAQTKIQAQKKYRKAGL